MHVLACMLEIQVWPSLPTSSAQAAAHAAAAGQEGAGVPSTDAGTSSATAALPPLLGDVARVLEGPLGLKPGRDCVVGEGLATVDLALFIQGKQVRA